MDQSVKNAMMEFLEPGSSIETSRLLDEFAILCNETKRASFSITRNVKTKKWRINLTRLHKSFINDSIRKAVIEAGEFVFKHRVKEDDQFTLTYNANYGSISIEEIEKLKK